MKMQKKQFRIGELAKTLNIERFVIRFWEKEFNVKGNRSHGGQRFYEEKDLQKFQSIKKLLYEQGFTIAGAKKQFKKNDDFIVGSHRTSFKESEKIDSTNTNKKFSAKLLLLKEQLLILKKILHS